MLASPDAFPVEVVDVFLLGDITDANFLTGSGVLISADRLIGVLEFEEIN